jgi:hypothetical protein
MKLNAALLFYVNSLVDTGEYGDEPSGSGAIELVS